MPIAPVCQVRFVKGQRLLHGRPAVSASRTDMLVMPGWYFSTFFCNFGRRGNLKVTLGGLLTVIVGVVLAQIELRRSQGGTTVKLLIHPIFQLIAEKNRKHQQLLAGCAANRAGS